MKNREMFKNEIYQITNAGDRIALVGDHPRACGKTDCRECDFFISSNSCKKMAEEWLKMEVNNV